MDGECGKASIALNQARKNLGNTKDNPSVGCIITNKNNVISAGCTSFDGRPHAEINSINLSKSNLKNSNLYVTLEPCSHYGKTPPCVKKIIDKKIKKVFFSIKDPDIRSHNKSKKILLNHRIKVKSGLLSDKIKRFYKSYIKYKKESLPFVTLKLAVSRDYFTISKKKSGLQTNFQGEEFI